MSEATLSSSQDLVVALDYGQFCPYTAGEDADLAVDLLGDALEVGLAQRVGLLIVVSPHQNNVTMPMRVEVWTGEPIADLDEWEEAFEAHLDVGEYGVEYNSPTLDFTTIPIPPGSYHALITGRGFVGHGWPGSTTPGDHWRLRLWPSDGPLEPARLRAYSEPAIERPSPVFDQAGVAAAGRTHKVLHDVTPLSGHRAAVRIQRRMPGTTVPGTAAHDAALRPDQRRTRGALANNDDHRHPRQCARRTGRRPHRVLAMGSRTS